MNKTLLKLVVIPGLLFLSSGCPEGSRVVVDKAAKYLPKRVFNLPDDAQKNDNHAIGPFCCTQRTLTVKNKSGQPVAYAYYYDFPPGGLLNNTTNKSYAENLHILVSGTTKADDPQSLATKSKIAFIATEMMPGFSRSTTAGAWKFTATVERADLLRVAEGNLRYDMESVAMQLEVSLASTK